MKKDLKTIIQNKIKDNPDMTFSEIATFFGISEPTLIRRIKKYGVKHNRKRGVRKGTEKDLKNV